jgi:hypothetical protein
MLETISALKREQSGTGNLRFGVSSFANKVSSVGFAGIKANLTEWFLSIISIIVRKFVCDL